jgi:RNA recognition motif-containing protein
MKHKRLYVGDLPSETTDAMLTTLFSEVGEIESITLQNTSPVQTFAFIEMVSPEAAKEAVRLFNGFVLEGRRLIVHTVPPKSRPRSAVTPTPLRRY